MSVYHGKIRVGVLRGGPSPEYEVSLKTGANVLKQLPQKYHPKDIFIDRQGLWHVDGMVRTPHQALKNVDVIFNALHGNYGEDGKVQQILDMFNVPYTGSKAIPSAVGMNKHLSKNIFRDQELKTAAHEILRRDQYTQSYLFGVYANLKKPLVVKPATAGSSIGVSIVKDYTDFDRAVALAFQFSDTVLVEEFVEGREATCAVVDSSLSHDIYALAPIEIIKPDTHEFFDYDAKYSGKSKEVCPGDFSSDEASAIADLAIKAHKALGLSHYSRSDFIVAPDAVYILETNSLPGLTSESLLPKALKHAGVDFPDFLDHVLVLALRKK